MDSGLKLQITTITYSGLQLVLLVLWRRDQDLQTPASVPAAALSLIASVIVVLLSYFEHNRSVRPSALLTTYLLLLTIFNAAQVRTVFLARQVTSIPAVMTVALAVGAALLMLEAQSKRTFLRQPFKTYSKEATSGIIGWSIFWWLNGVFRAGFGKLLTVEDIGSIDEELTGEPLGRLMHAAWERRSRPESRRTLPFAVAYCFRWKMLAVILPRVVMIGFYYAQPFLITRAINYLTEPETANSPNVGYGLIGATFLIYVGNAVSVAQNDIDTVSYHF